MARDQDHLTRVIRPDLIDERIHVGCSAGGSLIHGSYGQSELSRQRLYGLLGAAKLAGIDRRHPNVFANVRQSLRAGLARHAQRRASFGRTTGRDVVSFRVADDQDNSRPAEPANQSHGDGCRGNHRRGYCQTFHPGLTIFHGKSPPEGDHLRLTAFAFRGCGLPFFFPLSRVIRNVAPPCGKPFTSCTMVSMGRSATPGGNARGSVL
jgi:hypothetical protein